MGTGAGKATRTRVAILITRAVALRSRVRREVNSVVLSSAVAGMKFCTFHISE